MDRNKREGKQFFPMLSLYPQPSTVSNIMIFQVEKTFKDSESLFSLSA